VFDPVDFLAEVTVSVKIMLVESCLFLLYMSSRVIFTEDGAQKARKPDT
jgi:hypothetical protein